MGNYVGEFKDGEPNGQCTYTSPEGLKYVGEMKNSQRHGYGTETYPDGNIYEGEIKNKHLSVLNKYKLQSVHLDTPPNEWVRYVPKGEMLSLIHI